MNAESSRIEVVYTFPVEEEAAVIIFEAQVDNRKVSTQIIERQDARKEYDKAVQNRKTAVLLEETQPDIFQIKVGQLQRNEEAKINITYISELPVEDGKVKLTIPTTIASRYAPPSDDSKAAQLIASISHSVETSAPLSFDFTGVAQSKVKSIKSPSHELKLRIENYADQHEQFTYSGELAIQKSDIYRDIVIYIDPRCPDFHTKVSPRNLVILLHIYIEYEIYFSR